jgi:hypothetical protein
MQTQEGSKEQVGKDDAAPFAPQQFDSMAFFYLEVSMV